MIVWALIVKFAKVLQNHKLKPAAMACDDERLIQAASSIQTKQCHGMPAVANRKLKGCWGPPIFTIKNDSNHEPIFFQIWSFWCQAPWSHQQLQTAFDCRCVRLHRPCLSILLLYWWFLFSMLVFKLFCLCFIKVHLCVMCHCTQKPKKTFWFIILSKIIKRDLYSASSIGLILFRDSPFLTLHL